MIRHFRFRCAGPMLLVAATVLACSADPAGLADSQVAVCARLELALRSVPPEAPGTLDAIHAEQEVIARVVPLGYAGLLLTGPIDGLGGHTIVLVYPGSAEATRRIAWQAADCAGDGTLQQMFLVVAQSTEVRSARWDMITLRRWERQLRGLAADVTGTAPDTDISTYANTIYVVVPDEAAQARVEEGAEALGIPWDAVIVMVDEPTG